MDDAAVTVALCQLLGEIPGWHWSPTGAPAGDEVVVFYGNIPDSPDRAVGVRVYGGADPRVYAPERSVQLRFRGARGAVDSADQLAGAAFAALQGRSRVSGISRIERSTFGPWGADANGREERSDNYLVYIDNPEMREP